MTTNGIILIDKPSGPGSREVDRKIARHLGVRKFGHVGTLDPLATGLLIVLLGQGTKLSQFLVGARKRYQAVVELGYATDTYDVQGHRTGGGDPTGVTREQVEEILNRFRGRFEQVPPPYSAIKVDGVATYKRARKGEQIELPARTVEIAELAITFWEPPRFGLDVRCSKGTYLRSLAHDIGRLLGCGGVLAQICRVESEPFHLMHATDYRRLLDMPRPEAEKLVIPLDQALPHLPVVQATAALDARLETGNLPLARQIGPIAALNLRAGERFMLVGSRRLAVMEVTVGAREMARHRRPVRYLRVLERD